MKHPSVAFLHGREFQSEGGSPIDIVVTPAWIPIQNAPDRNFSNPAHDLLDFAARNFFHLKRCAAAMRLRAATGMRRLFGAASSVRSARSAASIVLSFPSSTRCSAVSVWTTVCSFTAAL
jgi:hypothetical protein